MSALISNPDPEHRDVVGLSIRSTLKIHLHQCAMWCSIRLYTAVEPRQQMAHMQNVPLSLNHATADWVTRHNISLDPSPAFLSAAFSSSIGVGAALA